MGASRSYQWRINGRTNDNHSPSSRGVIYRCRSLEISITFLEPTHTHRPLDSMTNKVFVIGKFTVISMPKRIFSFSESQNASRLASRTKRRISYAHGRKAEHQTELIEAKSAGTEEREFLKRPQKVLGPLSLKFLFRKTRGRSRNMKEREARVYVDNERHLPPQTRL